MEAPQRKPDVEVLFLLIIAQGLFSLALGIVLRPEPIWVSVPIPASALVLTFWLFCSYLFTGRLTLWYPNWRRSR